MAGETYCGPVGDGRHAPEKKVLVHGSQHRTKESQVEEGLESLP